MNWFRRKPNAQALLSELAQSWPGKAYSRSDKFNDFRTVFMSTEQGRRVLYEILTWSGMFLTSAGRSKFDPYETMFHDGERNIALQLIHTINAEPKERPASTKENS